MSTTRIQAIDAARGAAMLFVLVAHFGNGYFHRVGAISLRNAAWHVGMVASPTFMMISGLLLGYLYAVHREDFSSIQHKLIGRGIFLLTVGHLFILVAHVPYAGGFWQATHWLFITDTIGLCFIIGPSIVRRTTPMRRLLLAAVIYEMSWLVTLIWRPESMLTAALKDAAIGPSELDRLHLWADEFPVFPWLAVYLASSSLGEEMRARIFSEGDRYARRLIGSVGVAFFFLAAASYATIRIFYRLVFRVLLSAADSGLPVYNALISPLSSITKKLPPSPVYFFFYGGVGLLMLYALLWAEQTGRFGRAFQLLIVLGQTSLFAFILQYYVFFSLLPLAHPTYSPLWPLYLLASVTIVIVGCLFWHRRGHNRLMTLPILQVLTHLCTYCVPRRPLPPGGRSMSHRSRP